MRRAQNSSGTKGIMALEALIGTILSVVALVGLIVLFSDLLPTEENEVIAINNANSIVDFVNYFQNDPNYKSLENCFNILQLDFQTHFQYVQEGKENYLYLISKQGVYLVPFSKLPLFYEDVDSKNLDLSEFYLVEEFNQEVELYFDNTDKTSLNWLTSIVFVTDELNLELSPIEGVGDMGFYFLRPQVTDTLDKVVSYIPFVPDESNNYEVSVYENELIFSDDLEYLLNPHYLVYSHNTLYGKPILFVTNSKYTIPQVKNNLCSQKYFSNIVLQSFYENPNNIDKFDYSYNEIIFQDLTSNANIYSFSWKDGPICKINSIIEECKKILLLSDTQYYVDKNYEITYKDFINEIKLLLKDRNLNFDTGDLKVKEIIPLSDSDLLNSVTYFDDVFRSLDIEEVDISKLEDTDYLNNNNFLDITQFNNDFINGCEEDVCNLLKLKNNQIYFYTGGLEIESNIFSTTINNLNDLRYKSFNELFIRKKEILNEGERNFELYFKGEKIEYELFEPEQKGVSIPFYDDPELEPYVYRFVLNNIIDEGKNLNIEIFISSYQFNRIPEIKGGNTNE